MAWTVDDLKNDYQTLRSYLNSATSYSDSQYIKRSIYIVSKYIEHLESNSNYHYIYGEDKDDISVLVSSVFKYKKCFPAIIETTSIAKNNDYDYSNVCFNKDDHNNDISKEDMLDLLHDMFKSCGRKIYKLYSKMEKDRERLVNFNIDENSSFGVIYPIPILRKSYISVGTSDNLMKNTLSTLTHEYGHGIGSLINDNRYNNGNNFSEIESFFFELIGLDCYRKATNDPFYDKLNKKYISNLIMRCHSIMSIENSCEEALSSKTTSYKSIKDNCMKLLTDKGYNFKDEPINLNLEMSYAYSALAALELFYIYKEDKKEAFNILEKIVNRDKEEDEIDSINNRLILCKSLTKQIKEIKHVNND